MQVLVIIELQLLIQFRSNSFVHGLIFSLYTQMFFIFLSLRTFVTLIFQWIACNDIASSITLIQHHYCESIKGLLLVSSLLWFACTWFLARKIHNQKYIFFFKKHLERTLGQLRFPPKLSPIAQKCHNQEGENEMNAPASYSLTLKRMVPFFAQKIQIQFQRLAFLAVMFAKLFKDLLFLLTGLLIIFFFLFVFALDLSFVGYQDKETILARFYNLNLTQP